MSYETGMIVWGAAKSVGNIWIVTSGDKRTVSLVFDGKLKLYCRDESTTRHDTIKMSSFLYELTPNERANHTFQYGAFPQWAQNYINMRATTAPSTKGLSPISKHITPAVVQKVQKALGVQLTEEPERVILRKDESICPVNGDHRYVGYTGLIQSFEYCVHCDAKRPLAKVEA